MIQETPEMREPRAEHEAGHVVVALALGIDVVSVNTFPGETVCGLALAATISRGGVAPADAKRAALFCLAGVLYEDLLAGLYDNDEVPPIPPSRPHGPGSDDLPDDLFRAYGFADMVNGREAAHRTMVDWTATALEILRRNLEPARAIAEALQDAGELSGDTVRRLWHKHGGCSESES